MTWFATPANEAAASAEVAHIVDFVSMDLPSGFLRLHTRLGDIVWDSVTWTGVGTLGTIEIGAEDTELRPVAFRLMLSGVDAALVTAARSEAYHGRAVRVYRGYLDPTTQQLVGTPERRRVGIMDTMQVTLGQNTGTITVSCESELARWQRIRGLMYTHESQQILYAGDRGFDLVPTVQNRVVDWGPYKTIFGTPVEGMIRRVIGRVSGR